MKYLKERNKCNIVFFSVGLIVIVGTDQTRNDEITYADPTFFKQKAQKPVRDV